jgi:hypothetical protein
MWPCHRIRWLLINLTIFSPLISSGDIVTNLLAGRLKNRGWIPDRKYVSLVNRISCVRSVFVCWWYPCPSLAYDLNKDPSRHLNFSLCRD